MYILAPSVVALRLEPETQLLACPEIRELGIADGIRIRVPDGRAVREPVETTFPLLQVDEFELVRGVVVDERGGQAGNVVDARAIVNDPETRGFWCGREVRKGRRIADAIREKHTAEEVLCGGHGR